MRLGCMFTYTGKMGDVGNADYWYARAGKKRPDASLEQEWEAICSELLERSD